MKLFKVISHKLRSRNGGDYQWIAPTFKRGKWVRSPKTRRITNISVCYRGYHLTNAPKKWIGGSYNEFTIPFLAAGFGKYDKAGDKFAYQQAQLIRPISPTEWMKHIGIAYTPPTQLVSRWKKDPKMLASWILIQKKMAALRLAEQAKRELANKEYKLKRLKTADFSTLEYTIKSVKEVGIDVTEVEKLFEALKTAVAAVKLEVK